MIEDNKESLGGEERDQGERPFVNRKEKLGEHKNSRRSLQ